MPKVLIEVGEYNSLLESQDRLQALEGAGVDNWDGYSDAMEALRDAS